MSNREMNAGWLAIYLTGMLLACFGTSGSADEFFEKEIRPVLVNHCYECHSAESKKLKGGLNLDSREGFLRGGDTGAAVVPGKPEDSLILKALHFRDDLEMPPDGQLDEEIIHHFEKWITNGAHGGSPERRDLTTPEKRVDEKTLWSLQPLRNSFPTLDNQGTGEFLNPIDVFLDAARKELGIPTVDQATPYQIVRRLYLDLIGISPEPADIESFLIAWNQNQDMAIQTTVERLIQDKGFGERWGRHWMDVARYADSNGKSRDVLFPHAWRYRNWIIDAINADLPYDQFIQHQIAGDILARSGSHSSQDAMDQMTVATGFLAIGSKPLSGGNLPLDLVDDQIDAVTRGFLGLTVSCARCHDHKFDPVSTEDYYSLAGIFGNTKTFYGGGVRRPKKLSEMAAQWLVLGHNPNASPDQIKKLESQIDNLNKQKKNKKNRDGAERQLMDEQLAELESKLARLKEDLVFAMAVKETGKPKDMEVRIRGEKNNRGKSTPRGFPASISFDHGITIPEESSGRRQLARWISHPDNPLTYRVAVNRIWSRLTGAGLVRTVDNFGVNGERPTHPELLDWLAGYFKDHGYSRKALISLIATSRA